MSRTDKDRPYWVQSHDETNLLAIHHVCDGPWARRRTDGECIVSTIDLAKQLHGRRYAGYRHYRVGRCRKLSYEYWTCTKAEARENRTGRFATWRSTYREFRKPQGICWNEYTERDEDGQLVMRRTQCLGHRREVRDDSIPCACDDFIQPPTCYPVLVNERYGRFSDRPNADDRRTYYHGPERRRERDELRDAVKLHRGGDLDDGYDFFNRQARGSVRWEMW